MSTLHHPSGGFPLDPQSEANELRDIGAADCSPTLGSRVTWDHIDAMWAAEMERQDRQSACPQGYREAACEACGCGLYVPVGQGGDVLCPQCQREGEALAAEAADDDGGGPRPPTAGAMHPDYPQFAALAARLLDDQLCDAIGVADAELATFRVHNPEQATRLPCRAVGGGGAAAGAADRGVTRSAGAAWSAPSPLPPGPWPSHLLGVCDERSRRSARGPKRRAVEFAY